MTAIYFVLILGVVVFSHELGHFIFAKRAGIYVYEFAIGMGPKLFGFKRKNDETLYSIRLIPIGGYVKMAGEEIDEDKNIPTEKRMQSKSWLDRFLTVVAGATFNFILAIIIFFIVALIQGAPETRPYITKIEEGYPAYTSGLKKGDLILKVNNHKVNTWDEVLIEFEIDKDKVATFEVKRGSEIKQYTVKALSQKIDGNTVYRYGLLIDPNAMPSYGFIPAVKYAFTNFAANIVTMFSVITKLVTGVLGINNLAGPVGIYNIVGQTANAGFMNVLDLIAFLSINVGFVNLIPFPAFDGGRVLFLIIEKIKGKPVNLKTENMIHAVGMVILLILMVLITLKDIKAFF